jgi:hypothetical protein
MPEPEKRIAIIGAGPAGLSLGKFLGDSGGNDITIFEKSHRIGGKSLSVLEGDTLVEFGTCYAILAHKITIKWMRQLGITVCRTPVQYIDDVPPLDYINRGSGPHLYIQTLRYLRARSRLLKALSRPNPGSDILEEASSPAVEWLAARNLGKIENLMHRVVTGMGYGDLKTLPVLHALRWVDRDLILSGTFNAVYMPREGWTAFWERLAAQMDVRLNSEITAITRDPSGCEIHFADGTSQAFDQIVCAIPMTDFAAMTVPTANERAVMDAIEWGGYAITLFAAGHWFSSHIKAFSDHTLPGSAPGRLVSARREGYEEGLGGHLYIGCQIPGPYSGPELVELLVADVEARGGDVSNVIRQQVWTYSPRYRASAIKSGILTTLKEMQGESNTWYTGATYSHEAVSNITVFNKRLSTIIAAKSRAD